VKIDLRQLLDATQFSAPPILALHDIAMKCLYLVTRSLDPTGRGRARWAMRWKPALNAFAITFGDRFPAAERY
jgi:hypothetical protein